jgi:hypothetical protein
MDCFAEGDRQDGTLTTALFSGASMLDQDHSYLRLYTDESALDAIHNHLAGYPMLAQQFEALTGWTIAYRETTASRVR